MLEASPIDLLAYDTLLSDETLLAQVGT
jgi:hypothetical protein